MDLAPNLVVAERYRLIRKIGQGGMGSVWMATHLGLDIPCAVKFIEGDLGSMAEAHARFEREARAAAQVRSPHVVQIIDHGVWEGTPYMAMELLEGEDLGARLTRVGRLSPVDICAIVAQLSRALSKAHAAGIVHRDLKPENVFLVRDDDREITKVLDFGIAKSTAGLLTGSATKTGAMMGTPLYMSPEQAQGTKTVDQRSDLWSVAVIVYQALTGRVPFDSDALGDLLMKILVRPIPVPSHVAPDLPPAFDLWWAKAANREPALRYQSARELSEALAQALGQSQLAEAGDPDRGTLIRRRDQPPALDAPATQPVPLAVQPLSATGTPFSQSVDGTSPPKRTGLYASIAVGVTAVVLLAVVGTMVAKARHDEPSIRAAASGSLADPRLPGAPAASAQAMAPASAGPSAGSAAPPPASPAQPTAEAPPPATGGPVHPRATSTGAPPGSKADAHPPPKKPTGVDFGI